MGYGIYDSELIKTATPANKLGFRYGKQANIVFNRLISSFCNRYITLALHLTCEISTVRFDTVSGDFRGIYGSKSRQA